MQIDVRDKSFEITFVNNWCREQYQELLELIDDLSDIGQQADNLQKAAKTTKDNTEAQGIIDKMKELDKRMREISVEIVGKPKKRGREKQYGIRELIVKEIVERNGYEYDEYWWEHNTDVEDVNDFMLKAMQKDLSKSTSKKK